MSTSLEDALNGKAVEEPNAPEMEAEAPAEVEVEATQEAAVADEQPEPEKPEEPKQPRDEKGKFAKKDKPEGEGRPDDWSYHAYKDEKAKRQELEARLAKVEAERQQPEPQPAPQIDPIDDPQGYTQHIQQQIQMATLQASVNLSERFARQQHGDEAFEAANQWARQPEQQALLANAVQSGDPWGEVIAAHKRHVAMQEIGDDPQAYRERIENEVRARLEAEMAEQAPQPSPTPPQPMPANFAKARNAGQRKGPEWAGPTSLDDALRR